MILDQIIIAISFKMRLALTFNNPIKITDWIDVSNQGKHFLKKSLNELSRWRDFHLGTYLFF